MGAAMNLSCNGGVIMPAKSAVAELELPWPPSVNSYWRVFRGRKIICKAGREYKQKVRRVVDELGIETISGSLRAIITLHPPDKRRRDWDNWHKAPMDALAHAGLLDDDSQIREAVVRFGEARRPGAYSVVFRRLSD